MYLSIGLAATMIGVCTKTLKRWDKLNKLKPFFRTVGNHRRYNRSKIINLLQKTNLSDNISNERKKGVKTAIYGRVSSSEQIKSGDLKRQLKIRLYCHLKGYKVVKSFSDIGSGLNDKRRGLHRLLKGVSLGKFDVVVVNYNDRRARFGLNIIKEYLANWGGKL